MLQGKTFDYDIALSFAGEDRGYAARILKTKLKLL